MTLHPMLVHFPIALLTVYCLAEFVRFKRVRELSWYVPVKAVLVVIGAVAAFLARQTGEMLEDAFRGDATLGPIVEAHGDMATKSVIIFGVIAIVYLLTMLGRTDVQSFLGINQLPSWLVRPTTVATRIVDSPWMILVALFGLSAITVTGALGGGIVYGPDVDPAVKFIFDWYGFQI